MLIDTSTLDTLPDRELKAGIAEVIKYGLINNIDFHAWLENSLEDILGRDFSALAYAIRVSCEEKAAIVGRDERESGVRAILNFGHTFGHAIETAMGYGQWLHGEAVAAGMVMAARLSCLEGYISEQDVGNVVAILGSAGLPVAPPPEVNPETFLDNMRRDKKAEAGNIKFVLLESPGKAFVATSVNPANLDIVLGKSA